MRTGETAIRAESGCAVTVSTGALRRFRNDGTLGFGMNKENYTPWDSAELLTDDEPIVEYLKTALEENDPAFFVKAVGNVAGPKSLMLPELPAPARRPSRSHGRTMNCPCDYPKICFVI